MNFYHDPSLTEAPSATRERAGDSTPRASKLRRVLMALLAGLGLASAAPNVHAGTAYWDANNAGAGSGATPTANWSSSSTTWNSSNVAGNTNAPVAWVANDDAVFSSGTDAINSYTVTVTSNLAANKLTFEDGATVSISGSGTRSLAIGAGGLAITGGSTSVNLNSSSTSSIAAAQSWTNTGTGTITVNGGLAISNQLTLSSGLVSFTTATNTGAGGVRINGAAVTTTQAGAFGTGTLQLSTGSIAAGTAADVTIANALIMDGGFTFNPSSSGSRHLIFTGGGTISGAPTITFSDTTGSGTQFTTSGLTLNSNASFNGAGIGTISAAIGEDATPRSITYSGAGTLVLSGANSYTGGTTISSGTLQIGAGSTTGSLSTTGAIVNNGTLAFNRSNAITQGTEFSGAAITGTGGLTKAGTGTLTLNTANSYDGGTNVNGGTLIIGVDNTLAITGAVVMNSTGSGSTPATLDLSNFSQTIGSLSVQNTNATTADTITIGSGKTLTVNGAGTIGRIGAASTTKAAITGAGSFTVTNSGGTFQVGGATSTNNAATLDMSGLSNFSADLGTTGTFRVGDVNAAADAGNVGASTVILAKTSTITTGTLNLGDSSSHASVQTLKLGDTSNTINADTINVGAAGSVASRSSGSMLFNTTTGTLKVRAADGVSRANMNLVNYSSTTGVTVDGTVDLTGHSSDLLLNALTMASRSNPSAAPASATFSFDTGTLDVTTIDLARRGTGGSGTATGTLTIGGGTATIGALTMATTATGSGATAFFNLSGGTTTIGSIAMGSPNGGTANATINVTGGTTTLGGNITRAVGSGASAINLDGGTLNMGGFNIGGTNTVTLNAKSGTLSNLAQLNNGGTLTKTTGGTLNMAGTNTYTGGTAVNVGTLTYLNTTAKPATGTTTVAASATLGLGVGGAGFFTSANVDSLFANTLTNVSMTATSNVGIDTTAGDFTYATSVAANTHGLAKLGSNTLTLTGNNSYSGPTRVDAGTLLANNTSGSATGTGAVSVTGTSRLGGTGSIAPTGSNGLTLASGTTLAPGASIESLDINLGSTTGTLSFASGAMFEFELGTPNSTLGSIAVNSSDLLSITGASAGDVIFGGNNINLLGTISGSGYYKLFDTSLDGSTWTGLTTGAAVTGGNRITSGLTISGSPVYWYLILADGSAGTSLGDIYLAIPEPSSLALLLCGSLGLWMVRRKRAV